MKKRTRTITAIAAVMLLAVSSVTVIPHIYDNYWNVGGPTEDFDGYIGISSPEELAMIGNNADHPLDERYYLTADIIFDPETVGNFDPIGSANDPFTGIFDGNGYVISGLNVKVHDENDAHAGLFASLLDAEVRDLGIKKGSFAASSARDAYAGSVAGTAFGSTVIEDCYSTGAVSASAQQNAYAGGMIGKMSGPSVICESFNTGPVEAIVKSPDKRAYAGGMIGHADAADGERIIVIDCYNTGPVSASTTVSLTDGYAG
ncbi:MAG: hypothetical protein LBH69_02020, partial [Methanomassiliicoccaceae archaeon]|nr:hypothetical protein [Methanomassiliicoccaceae archaeon]